MSVVIPVRIQKELAQKINQLVGTGLYSSRSSLVREALTRYLDTGRRLAATLASTIIAWNDGTITDIVLFGSTARGETLDESDIDLLILTEEAHPWKVRRRLYDFIYPIIPVFGIDISLIVVNRETFAEMIKNSDPFAESVISEGTQLQGGILSEYGQSTHGESS